MDYEKALELSKLTNEELRKAMSRMQADLETTVATKNHEMDKLYDHLEMMRTMAADYKAMFEREAQSHRETLKQVTFETLAANRQLQEGMSYRLGIVDKDERAAMRAKQPEGELKAVGHGRSPHDELARIAAERKEHWREAAANYGKEIQPPGVGGGKTSSKDLDNGNTADSPAGQ